MQQCIELGIIARQRRESPVGSILVLGDKIIGRGIEGGKSHLDITFHAEIEAIRQGSAHLGSQDLSGCVLYTTHEPCIMCSYVIRHTKINTVVIGLATGDTGGVSSKYPVLLDKTIGKWSDPPVLVHGVLEATCREL